MNPGDFFAALLRRHRVACLVPAAFLVMVGTVVAGGLDAYLRLGVSWRALVALALATGALISVRRRWVTGRLPAAEEIYAFAAREARHDELDLPPEKLELDPSRLRPYPKMAPAVLMVLLAVLLGMGDGRLALRRIWLLSGAWPARTRIEDLSVPRVVLQGEPVQVRFTTAGRLPPWVRLTLGGDVVQLVGTGTPSWDYAAYLEPGIHTLSIEAGDAMEEVMGIEVVKAPQLVEAHFKVEEPEYLGGRSWTSEGLTARIPEGSNVVLETRVEGGQALRAGAIPIPRDAGGMTSLDLGVVTLDTPLTLEVVVGHGLRDAVLARMQIFVVKDLAPVAEVIRPGDSITLPAGATLPLSLRFRDDRGLASATIVAEDPERKVITEVGVSGLEGTWEGSVRLPDSVKAGGRLVVRPEAVDTRGQVSRARGVTVHVVDDEAFTQHLSEQRQEISRRLEKLVESQERRVSRRTRDKLMSPSAERQAARDDARAVDELETMMKEHHQQLGQSKDGETMAAEAAKDLASLEQVVKPPMSDEAAGKESSLEDHKKSLDTMKDMADRMAKSQDLHAVMRLIDMMIERQKKVVEGIGP